MCSSDLERIRDKIAAQRRKGKWSGGSPVLGYDVDRSGGSPKLVVNSYEARRVREIFDLIDARFSKTGDARDFWTESVHAQGEEVAMTWFDIGEPLLIHTQPNQGPNPRPYGVCTLLVPALGARLTLNGKQANGQPWKREREGRPFSTCALAFSESWTEPR